MKQAIKRVQLTSKKKPERLLKKTAQAKSPEAENVAIIARNVEDLPSPFYELIARLRDSVDSGIKGNNANWPLIKEINGMLLKAGYTREAAANRLVTDCKGLITSRETIRHREGQDKKKGVSAPVVQNGSQDTPEPIPPVQAKPTAQVSTKGSHAMDEEAQMLCGASDPVKQRLQDKIRDDQLTISKLETRLAGIEGEEGGSGPEEGIDDSGPLVSKRRLLSSHKDKQRLIDDLHNQGRMIEQLTNQRDEVQMRADSLSGKVGELELLLLRAEENRSAEIDKLRADADVVQREMSDRFANIEAVERDVQVLRVTNKELEGYKEDFAASNESLARKVEELSSEIQVLNAEVLHKAGVISRSEAQIREKDTMIEGFGKERQQLEVSIAELSQSAADTEQASLLQQENDRLVDENKVKDEELDTLRLSDVEISGAGLIFRLQRLFLNIEGKKVTLRYPARIYIHCKAGNAHGVDAKYNDAVEAQK